MRWWLDYAAGLCSPEPVYRHHVQTILVGVGPVPEVQGDTSQEIGANSVPQLSQRSEVAPRNTGGRLHFEGHDGAVVALHDQIYFVIVMRAPVAAPGKTVEPRCLLQQLANHESL